MNRQIFITKPIPQEGLDLLRPHARLDIGPEGPNLTTAELSRRAAGVDALLCFVADPVDRGVLEALAPTCRIVANYGVGYDNIDIAAATELGIQVTNTPGVLTESTADLTFALLLASARGLKAGQRLARSGAWPGIEPLQIFGHDVAGKTLGIVGPGRIGAAVARRATGFDMTLLYTARDAHRDMDDLGAQRVALDDLLHQADFVSLHVPLTADTRHLIGADELRRMKPTAFLINTSRGAVIHEADLITALQEGWLAGAGLDVYEDEPHIPTALLERDNVVCLPHMGSATWETRSRIAVQAARNILAVFEGCKPPNPVN